MNETFSTWVLARLESAGDAPNVIVRDPLHLLPEVDGLIHSYAREHGYTVIVAATNLVFRELYEQVKDGAEAAKIMLIDRSPARRREAPALGHAPALFYPDLLAVTPPEARIDLDLRQFLCDTTGDGNWPHEANNPIYARLIAQNLDGVLRAHQNLRTADRTRFTDADFRTIVAYAALGVPEAAFKSLSTEDHWRIALLAHEALEKLESIDPEVTKPIKTALSSAPAPFSWFQRFDPDTAIRAFYLSLILAQHADNWQLLLSNIDPALASLPKAERSVLQDAASKLITLGPDQARRDLQDTEASLSRDALEFLLLDQMKLSDLEECASALEREKYSALIRSLALLLALDNLLSSSPKLAAQERIARVVSPDVSSSGESFADTLNSSCWLRLKQCYCLARDVLSLREELAVIVKNCRVMKTDQLSFGMFWKSWNGKRLNRLEYYLSALERIVGTGDLLPRPVSELPPVFGQALERVRQRVADLTKAIHANIDELNGRFQDLVAMQYPSWIAKDTDVYFTSQFLRRCLKAHWDPQKEKALVLVFDGMRYEIWDEFLRPQLLERMELIAELPASALLPTETHLTRKAIAAGALPDQFDSRAAEDKLLQDGLARVLGDNTTVQVALPEGAGVGETVRYHAGNLDVYIFEVCDKTLHGIGAKKLPDGRLAPARPLAFLYQQHVKNLLETEVMGAIRSLAPGTKVFVVADHGFTRVGREKLWFDQGDLNEPDDCAYLNCYLRVPFEQADIPPKVRSSVIAFSPEQLHLPTKEIRTVKGGHSYTKEYRAVAFPRVGYAFSRPGSHFEPDAYSHGGISLPEMLIPMAVLRVKAQDQGIITLGSIFGPTEVVEGQEAEFRLRLARGAPSGGGDEDVRVEVDAVYARDPERFPLRRQTIYVSAGGAEVVFRFKPDPADASDDERRCGRLERTLIVTVRYREGRRMVRKSASARFAMVLNTERIVRRVGNLGAIMGLTPKSMR